MIEPQNKNKKSTFLPASAAEIGKKSNIEMP
jgi:hypothetical protein